MSRVLPILIITLLAASCRPPAYVQPQPNEPHAILKIRHIVHARGGPFYASQVRVGRFSVDERTLEDQQGGDGSIIHLRVHPRADAVLVAGTSYHVEQRMVTRYRSVQEPYSCSSQQCSGGYGSTPRSCHSVYQTCYRSRQVPYQQMESVNVTDDACSGSFPLAPAVGATYLMQFDYLGENQCQLTCFEQVPNPLGAFELVPCTPAVLPPPTR
jgi:hypothetical protein